MVRPLAEVNERESGTQGDGSENSGVRIGNQVHQSFSASRSSKIFDVYELALLSLGLSTSCSATFWQRLVFGPTFFVSSNFLHSEQFLMLSSNSEISQQLLMFELTFLSYFTMF